MPAELMFAQVEATLDCSASVALGAQNIPTVSLRTGTLRVFGTKGMASSTRFVRIL